MAEDSKLGWYVRRATRMSPVEVLHRVGEQAKRGLDRRQDLVWDSFPAFDGEIAGLPGVDFAAARPALLAIAAREAADARAGRFDYLGQAWPAPETPRWFEGKSWTLDPATGTHWPGAETFAFDVPYRHAADKGDVKFVWELNRLQMLQPLALHAAATRDEAATAATFDILDGWMAANPPWRGVNWNSGIELATRIVSVLVVQGALQGRISAASDEAIRRFLAAHVRFLGRYPSLHSSANNHRVAELAGLLIATLSAPGLPGAASIAALVRTELEMRIETLFFPDGVGAEQSPTYAAYSLEWVTLAGIVAQACGQGLSDGYRDRAAKAAEHLRWMIDEGGHTPHIGDDDEGRVLALTQAPEPRYAASVAAMTDRWLGRPQVSPSLRDPEIRDLAAAAVTPDATSPDGIATFADGGYTVRRTPTPRGQALLVFDHAPLGFLSIAAHGHADALSVWLNWGEEAVIVDAGTYLYHAGGTERDRFRGTAVHNTLCLDGQNQSQIAGAFNWSRHATTTLVSAGEVIEAEHDGYARSHGVIHRRRLVFLDGGGVRIEDFLLGKPVRPTYGFSLGYTLATGVSASTDGATALAVTPQGRTLAFDAAVGGDWSVSDAPCSPRFNRIETTRRLTLTGALGIGTDLPVAITTIRLLD